MCPPLIAAAPIILGVASAGVGVAGAVMNANAQSSSAEAQAKQAEQNAKYAALAEADAYRQGEADAGKARTQGTQLIGAQRVAYAASGVSVDSGSALDTYAETREVTELEAQTIRANAARDAWGYRTQGLEYNKQASLNREAGRQAGVGGFLTGAGQVLSGGAQVASYFRK